MEDRDFILIKKSLTSVGLSDLMLINFFSASSGSALLVNMVVMLSQQ